MHESRRSRTRSSTSARAARCLPLALCTLLGGARLARAQDAVNAIWSDETFKKQFIAGYGVNAEIEPRVTPEEVKLLEEIRPFMADQLPKAEALLQQKMKPNCSAILDFTLGSIQFQQDKLAEAHNNYQRAVGKFPSFRRAWRNLGLIHARDGSYEHAIKAFTEMLKYGGGDAFSYGLLGFAYAAKEDYQPAEVAYRNALLLQPDSTEWRLGLTRCVVKQRKFEDAANLLDALLARYPDNADFWMLQANTYLGMRQPLNAAANFETIDHLGKSSLDSLYTLGDIYLTENLMDLALRAYLRACDRDPQQALARPLRAAEVLASRGATEQAMALAAHMHEVFDARLADGERATLLKLDARLSMANGGGNAETAKVLEEIVQLNPLDGEALMLLGQHYSRMNEPDRAILYYERAAGMEEFEVNAKIRQAQVLVGMARYDDALPLLRRAQELRPRDDIARYLDQVERIAKSKR